MHLEGQVCRSQGEQKFTRTVQMDGFGFHPIFIWCFLCISFQFVGKVVLNVFHAHLIASCSLLSVTPKGLPQSSQQRARHSKCLPPGNSHSSRGRKMLEQICMEICISLDDSMHAHVLAWDYSIFTHLRDAHM